MIKNLFLILANLIYVAPGFCQELKVEATYWDEDNTLYKIERKYSDARHNAILYVRHTNENSVCVKKTEIVRRDTLIVQVDYCDLNRKKTKLENFSESDIQTVSSSKNKDSVTVSFYKGLFSLGDTLLTGSAARNNYELVRKIKDNRLALILTNDISIKPDSLNSTETVRSYFVKNNLVKTEVINSEKTTYGVSYCTFSGNKMVCKEYQDNNSRARVLSVDSLVWNADTTEIMWYTFKKEVNKKYVIKYVLNKNKLKLIIKDVLQKEITFVSDKNLFHKLVASNLIYNDPMYSCELYQFDMKRISKIWLPNDQEHSIEYIYDKQKRVTEQKQFDAQKKFTRVAYSYN